MEMENCSAFLPFPPEATLSQLIIQMFSYISESFYSLADFFQMKVKDPVNYPETRHLNLYINSVGVLTDLHINQQCSRYHTPFHTTPHTTPHTPLANHSLSKPLDPQGVVGTGVYFGTTGDQPWAGGSIELVEQWRFIFIWLHFLENLR